MLAYAYTLSLMSAVDSKQSAVDILSDFSLHILTRGHARKPVF